MTVFGCTTVSRPRRLSRIVQFGPMRTPRARLTSPSNTAPTSMKTSPSTVSWPRTSTRAGSGERGAGVHEFASASALVTALGFGEL